MNVSLETRYRYFVSDCGLQQNVKTFFKRPAVFVFVTVHSRLFYVAVTMALLRMVAHGAGFRGVTLFRSKNR